MWKKIKDTFKEHNILFAYTIESNIDKILTHSKQNNLIVKKCELIENYIEENLISLEQGLLALNNSTQDTSIKDTLNSMGLLIFENEVDLFII